MPYINEDSERSDAPATSHGVGRRRFLTVSALAAGSATLAACSSSGSGGGASNAKASHSDSATKGSAKEPLAKPASLSESPLLAAQVKAGKLPPVEQRLPEQPYVVPHGWVKRGNYGGNLSMLVSDTNGYDISEWFYEYSLVRFLNEGLDVGPGVAQKWESNADTSVWTLHFRKGLRWSDGQPWTTADIMFWWNDMANDAKFTGGGVPDECKSSKGTVATLAATDDFTLVITFDTPSPLFIEKVAEWVNGYQAAGAPWMVPSHYVKQFHPKYNKKVPETWAAVGGLWETHASYRRNPKCPTLAPFRLTSYNEGHGLSWERNPYSYLVTSDGDQLPYIDTWQQSAVQDPQVGKIKISTGGVDLSHGRFNSIQLADVSTLTKYQDKYGYQVRLWDTGSGTASVIFFSQDYQEANYRKLFRDPKFRQAMSLAFNRPEAQKVIYFEQGEITTGTVNPKTLEFTTGADGKAAYEGWRDSFAAYDTDKAKQLLDGLGLKDADGDGFREFPDGSKLTLRIELQADADDEHVQKDTRLVRDWAAVGINTKLNRVPPTAFEANWESGKYMLHSDWEVSGPPGPGLLNFQWMVPTEPSRWAPLQGQMYSLRGTPTAKTELDVDPYKRHPPRVAPEPGGPIDQLYKLLGEGFAETDAMKRQATFYQIVKIHKESGPFFMGVVADYPAVVVVKNGLMNVPTHDDLELGGSVNGWEYPTPAVYDPSTYFWDKPEQHTT